MNEPVVCNTCGWAGYEADLVYDGIECPKCGSTDWDFEEDL